MRQSVAPFVGWALGLLALVGIGPVPSLADTPLPPPRKHVVPSPSAAVEVESDPASGTTTVFSRGPGGERTRRWSMPGWYRALYPANDGDHLVIGHDGLDLLPPEAGPELVVLRFVRRGEIVAALTLAEAVEDLSTLRRTASHLAWRAGEGFDAQGRFFVESLDGVRHVFDVATGARLDTIAPPPVYASDLDRLAAWLTGTFSSAAQAREDPEYLDVRLVTAPCFLDRSDGRWIYLEQALAATPDKPYRQRVYRLRALGEGYFESRVYELPDPAAAVGAGARTPVLGGLSPEALLDRPGCAVVLRAEGDAAFLGGTLGPSCASTFSGAAHVTTEVVVRADAIVSWDRGFASDGRQVWGAVKGGYQFLRVPSPTGRERTR